MNFTARLKTALVGDPNARFVYLNNFEVERAWARDEPKLPGAGIAFAGTTVNRMEEMGVLLAGPGDVVVLKAPVDPDYAQYLVGLECAQGLVLSAERAEPARSVTEDALASPRLLASLGNLGDGRTYLLPLGVSAAEERLAKETGLPLAGAPAAVSVAVNGKIYSRELCDTAGLRKVPGANCRTAGELPGALQTFLLPGGRAVVKESLGVSGRGMVVLDDPVRADRLVRMVRRRGDQARVDLVVESWVDKVLDLNYQFIVSRTGDVQFETVKAAVVQDGVHKGHRFPVELPDGTDDELRRAADLIGRALFADGYYGMVGVDAMLGRDGTLYPCLEINARFNMATYQSRVAERFIGPGRHAIATTISLRPRRRHSFDEVADALGDLLFDGSGRPGLLVNNFATLNAAARDGGQFHGRVYGICIADDADAALRLQYRTEEILRELVGRG
jgi:hypothetical protein